jgi:hypothetical protein
VATTLTCLNIAQPTQSGHAFFPRNERRRSHGKLGSYGDINQFAPGLVTGLQAEFDRFSNICERLLPRLALGNAPRQHGALGYDPSVFSGPQNDRQSAHEVKGSTLLWAGASRARQRGAAQSAGARTTTREVRMRRSLRRILPLSTVIRVRRDADWIDSLPHV